MQQTSTVYQKEMAKIPYRGRSYVRINLGVIDLDAAGDATISATHEDFFSQLSSLVRTDGVPKSTYATFETGRFKVDGMQLVASKNAIHPQGYASSVLTDKEGVFNQQPTIDFRFSKGHSCPALTFVFDATTGDYPTELDVQVYRGSALIDTHTVTPDASNYIYYADFINFTRIRLTFKKGAPRRRARLQQIQFGAGITFDNSSISSTSWQVDIDPVMRRATEDKFEFKIINKDGVYDADNPRGIWEWVEEQQPVTVEYGQYINTGLTWADMAASNWGTIELTTWKQVYEGGFTEWMNGGRFILTGRPESAGLLATFSAQDRLSALTDTYNKGSYAPKGRTLYDLAVAVLADADVPVVYEGELPYALDAGLKLIKTTAPMPKVTHRECLQMIAHAAGMIAYTDRSGIVRIEPISGEQHGFNLDFDTLKLWPAITKVTPLHRVDVNVYKYEPAADESELHKDEYTAGSYFAEFEFATDIKIKNSKTITVRITNPVTGYYDEQDIRMPVAETAAPKISTQDVPEWNAYETQSVQLEASGSGGIVWSVSKGKLPDGIRLSRNGLLSGYRKIPAYRSVVIRATNSYGYDEMDYNVIVNAAEAPSITTSKLVNAQGGTAYSQRVEATGTGTITFALKAKDSETPIPAGMSITSGGRLNWTAPAWDAEGKINKYNFMITATGVAGMDEKSYSLEVVENAVRPEFTTKSLPEASKGEPYETTIEAAGTSPISFTPQELPYGLSLDIAGVISGTPTQTYSIEVDVRAVGIGGATTKTYILTVAEASQPKLTTTEMPVAIVGQAYRQQIETSGSDNLQFSLISGSSSLPPGLSINSKGVISGTPASSGISGVQTTGGTASFTVDWSGEVLIAGKKLETSTTLASSTTGRDGETEIVDNRLITDRSAARTLATQIKQYLMMRTTYECDYRGNPELDASDLLYMQSRYDPEFKARLLKHRLEFDGTLKGNIVAKRMAE